MTTTIKTATNNFKVDTAMNTTVDTEAELIKHNGLSFEGYLATNAGLTIEEYRARKAANEAAEQAEAERRTKIFNLKDGIKSAEYTITETSGTLNDIIKNHYRPETDDGSWDEYTAELGDTLATAVSTLDTLKAQLAELEPAIENNTTEAKTTVETEVECKPQTAWENPHDFTTVGNLNGQPRKYVDPEAIAAPKGFWANRINGTYTDTINGEYVEFENHSIAYIGAEKKLGFHYKKSDAGRKIFYRCNRRFAASKIAEAYMNGEIAAEQNKAHHEFFNAHKTAYNNFFQVLFRVTTADGRIHNFERTFETFDDAKALVDEFTATFDEPTDIIIKQNKQNGEIYYTRTDGNPGNYTDAYFGNDGFDPEAFTLLPALDDLNDTDDEPTTDFTATKTDEPKEFTADCYYTYTKDGVKWSGSQSKNFATATEAANWIINLVRENGYTLTEPTNIRDWENHKRYYANEADFNAVNGKGEDTTAHVEETAQAEPLTKEQIEKLMHAIAVERGEFYDALEEAEADEEISQSHIDYLKDEIDRLGEEYNELWAQLVKLQEAEETAHVEPEPATGGDKPTETREGDWEISNKLTRKLNRNVNLSNYMEVITQDGERTFVNFGAPHVEPDGNPNHGFAFVHYDTTLGRYDTREQAETVINLITATVERGEEKFIFPTVDELTAPHVEEPADESEPTEVKCGAKFVEGKFYNDMDWATFGAGKKCFKILKRTACYVTIGDYSPYRKDYFENGRYKIKTDSDGNEYTNYWSGERLCAQFLTVDEHIRDSLKRAAEIARQKYHEYEREGDKAGMRREIELYSICTDAIKELEAA